MNQSFTTRLLQLQQAQAALLLQPNKPQPHHNGVIQRYQHPILTAAHTPLHWRYDLNEQSNPFLMERFGINAVLNAGAIKWNNRYVLMARVEGADRKSFFAIAQSEHPVQGFSFWDRPVSMPQTDNPDTNIYDIRLVAHEDGWLYGLFCTERRDPQASAADQSAAIAQCGIARTKDLMNWERLPDLVSPSAQQRNVVLHPEWVDGQYAFYTRPQDGFIDAGNGGGIGFALSAQIAPALIKEETILHRKRYHTVYELKNGLGPAPIKTEHGWLHLAHGVRNTAAGLRYVLYMFMTHLQHPSQIIYCPGGYLMAPEGEERVGDVSNVLFCNGWIKDDDGKVYIYYASSDTRMHVAETSVERLLDYVMHTPADGFSAAHSVNSINTIIDANKKIGG